MPTPAIKVFHAALLALLLGFYSVCAHANPPKVLTSIKAVQLLTQAIMGDLDTSEVLLPTHASAHHYQLKPSDVRRIQNTDLIIWVGPELESFLAKPFQQLKPDQTLLTLLPMSDIILPLRQGYTWDMPPAGTAPDPHAWLNTDNALSWATAIAQHLSDIDPDNATHYANHLADFQKDLGAVPTVSATPKQYLAYHDALQYFDAQSGMLGRAPLHLHHQHKQGGHLNYLHDLLKSNHIDCIVTEPFVTDDTALRLSNRYGVPIITVDPLGVALPEEAGFIDLIQAPHKAFEACQKD